MASEFEREFDKLRGVSRESLLFLQETYREQYKQIGPRSWLVTKLEAIQTHLDMKPVKNEDKES